MHHNLFYQMDLNSLDKDIYIYIYGNGNFALPCKQDSTFMDVL